MASVCLRLFGKRPAFLAVKPRRNLYELMGGEEAERRVTTTRWVGQDFAECFYTLEELKVGQDLKSGSARGRLTWFGKERQEVVDIQVRGLLEMSLKDSTKRIWMLYNGDKESAALSRKVSGARIVEKK